MPPLPTTFAGLALIPLFPLLGAAVCGLGGKPLQRRFGRRCIHAIAIGAMLLAAAAAVASVVVLFAQPPAARLLHQRLWTLVDVPPVAVDVAFALDPLSAVMILVITLVGTAIHVYATGYMAEDPGAWRFFACLNLFVFAMLVLVLGDSLLLMFFGWEGVGLCSYLLIGFWFTKTENAAAGRKAFIVNRIGDWGFVFGVLLLFWGLGGVDGGTPTMTFHQLRAQLPAGSGTARALADATLGGVPLLLWVGLGLFFGVAGKSAQIPLYVWLPDAMAGPTPVSALIHAATMVTAGVYLFARLSFVFVLSPATLACLAVAGAATAALGAVIAVFQTDIKRVLAYSTVSQLGFMVLALGCGAPGAAIFHVVTHACFKACLFLAAGSVLHGMHAVLHVHGDAHGPAGDEHAGRHRNPRRGPDARDAQDLRNMGGLRTLLPRTHLAYLVGCLAIVGAPLASGFYSKDEILLRTLGRPHGAGLFTASLLTSALTAFYMFRSYYMAFGGRPPTAAARARLRESPRSMTSVLLLLAAASIVVGPLLGWPAAWGGHPLLEHALAPSVIDVATPASATRALAVQLAGLVAAAAGWLGARALYRDLSASAPLRERLASRAGALHRAGHGKLYVDELYQAAFVAPLLAISRAASFVDRHVVDGLVRACAALGRGLAAVGGFVDRAIVDGAVNGVSSLVLAGGRRAARLQNGRINTYVLGIAIGVALLFALTWFSP